MSERIKIASFPLGIFLLAARFRLSNLSAIVLGQLSMTSKERYCCLTLALEFNEFDLAPDFSQLPQHGYILFNLL